MHGPLPFYLFETRSSLLEAPLSRAVCGFPLLFKLAPPFLTPYRRRLLTLITPALLLLGWERARRGSLFSLSLSLSLSVAGVRQRIPAGDGKGGAVVPQPAGRRQREEGEGEGLPTAACRRRPAAAGQEALELRQAVA
jgi:hypothetical protein